MGCTNRRCLGHQSLDRTSSHEARMNRITNTWRAVCQRSPRPNAHKSEATVHRSRLSLLQGNDLESGTPDTAIHSHPQQKSKENAKHDQTMPSALAEKGTQVGLPPMCNLTAAADRTAASKQRVHTCHNNMAVSPTGGCLKRNAPP